jgi:hypothetical protein
MAVYVHLGNALTGEVDAAGPFDFVQITYNTIVRVGDAVAYDGDFTIATFADGLWRWDDGSEWTDLTVSTLNRNLQGD